MLSARLNIRKTSGSLFLSHQKALLRSCWQTPDMSLSVQILSSTTVLNVDKASVLQLATERASELRLAADHEVTNMKSISSGPLVFSIPRSSSRAIACHG
jgi:hypothetical protein